MSFSSGCVGFLEEAFIDEGVADYTRALLKAGNE
jgi:hypothetical protein